MAHARRLPHLQVLCEPAAGNNYVFITPDTIEPVKMEVLRSEASDYLPVIAELRLR